MGSFATLTHTNPSSTDRVYTEPREWFSLVGPLRPREEKVAVGVTKTTVRTYAAKDARATLLFAHGAGAPQTHPFMVRLAQEIAAAGVTVVTFNFPYSEAKKKRPDPPRVLHAAFVAVVAHVAARAERLLLGGKSMGGRIALEAYGVQCQVPAKERMPWLAKVRGFCFFGYPLHPPASKTAKTTIKRSNATVRAEAFDALRVPIHVVQGERDTFGGERELAPLVRAAPKGSELFVVPTGDHSLAVRKSMGMTQSEVDAEIARRVARFVEHVA